MPSSCSMTLACAVLLAGRAAGLGDGKKGRPMKEVMGWYHSGDEIHSELVKLIDSCQEVGADAEMFTAGSLDVMRVRASGALSSGTKAVLVFGEHARELISPETALGFVRSLCGQGAQAGLARETLAKGVEFVVVPNANPNGRKVVEEGYYCKRTNGNGVDLNRNWGDDHRNMAGKGDEENPGPRGFSEPETQALRDLIDQESPDIYVSVHSGAYLLGASPGWEENSIEDKKTADEVLRPISAKRCNGKCPYGGLRDMLGYNAAGCDIDYVHDHQGVPYSYTFEIYNGYGDMQSYFKEQDAKRALKDADMRSKMRASLRGGAAFLGTGEDPEHLVEDDEEPKVCMGQFLPATESATRDVVNTWSGAFLDLASIIVERKQKALKSAPSTTAAPAMLDSRPELQALLASAPQVQTGGAESAWAADARSLDLSLSDVVASEPQ